MKRPCRRKALAATVLAASVGAASVLGHEEKHVELRRAAPDAMAEIYSDYATMGTATFTRMPVLNEDSYWAAVPRPWPAANLQLAAAIALMRISESGDEFPALGK